MTTGAFGIGLTFIGRKGPGPYEYPAVPKSWKPLKAIMQVPKSVWLEVEAGQSTVDFTE